MGKKLFLIFIFVVISLYSAWTIRRQLKLNETKSVIIENFKLYKPKLEQVVGYIQSKYSDSTNVIIENTGVIRKKSWYFNDCIETSKYSCCDQYIADILYTTNVSSFGYDSETQEFKFTPNPVEKGVSWTFRIYYNKEPNYDEEHEIFTDGNWIIISFNMEPGNMPFRY